jgi:hypothetical protein
VLCSRFSTFYLQQRNLIRIGKQITKTTTKMFNSPKVIVFTINISFSTKQRCLTIEGIFTDATLQTTRMPLLIDGGQIEAILQTREKNNNTMWEKMNVRCEEKINFVLIALIN